MRIARLLAAVSVVALTALTSASFATAQPPFRLPDYVTDNVGVLNNQQLTTVQQAITNLYDTQHIRLWVVYVASFAPQNALDWTQNTRRISDLNNQDAILAVATTDRSYAFLVPSNVPSNVASRASSRADRISSTAVDALRRDHIEPALRANDWSGAAIAAATGLATESSTPTGSVSWMSVLGIAGIIAVLLVALVLWSRSRQRKRHRTAVTAARRLDLTNSETLATVPLKVLDDVSTEIVVDVDNAVRTSKNELILAVDEFGQQATAPFASALNSATEALAQAFTIRQQLDDAIPETPTQRRQLLIQVIVAAAQANRELETQQDAFHQLRDVVINAADRLDTLTQQLIDITTSIAPSRQVLTELHNEFADSAIESVAGNIDAAQERIDFADQAITRGRHVLSAPNVASIPGKHPSNELVDTIRSAESALQQARLLLTALSSAANDIRTAIANLPAALTDIQNGIDEAEAQLARGNISMADELEAARNNAVAAVTKAQTEGTTDPLGTFTQLTHADADVDRLLDEVTEERGATERLNRAYEKALFSAQSRVQSVSDFIDTRRGSIGPQARTRLSEATRQLHTAQAHKNIDSRSTITEAIAHAHHATMLATQAQQLANNDVQAAQWNYRHRYGNGPGSSHMGAMMGGIIVGNILSASMRGGFGGGSGWSSTTFGGSSGGEMFGGGGRF